MFESLRESSIFNVKTETVGYSNITSNWISEIQQRVSVKHNRLLEEETTREFSTLIARFQVTISCCINFVDFIFL